MIIGKSLQKSFYIKEHVFGREKLIEAVKDVSFEIGEKEIVGLVGESGSGKSTLGKIILSLIKPDQGTIYYKGTEITNRKEKELKFFRKEVQAVFQDPYSSLNPRLPVIESLKEPLKLHTTLSEKEIGLRVSEMLENVGIPEKDKNKYPHEFSGGQRQRINIARALILKPSFIVADEPVSSLDVSIQAQIINLFLELQIHYGFSMLFISHDLRIVRHISDRIMVMLKGEIVETNSSKALFEQTVHPYTKRLIDALPERTKLNY